MGQDEGGDIVFALREAGTKNRIQNLSAMNELCIFIGMTVFGWIGRWIGERV